MANKVLVLQMLLGTQESLIIIARYQLRCPELRYELAPIVKYRGRENVSAVLYLADVRIEVFNCLYCWWHLCK